MNDRLTMDPDVSLTSPVVRGTWVTVDQVIEMIVDGRAWSDVFRIHPELCEDDIRACLAHAIGVEECDAPSEVAEIARLAAERDAAARLLDFLFRDDDYLIDRREARLNGRLEEYERLRAGYLAARTGAESNHTKGDNDE